MMDLRASGPKRNHKKGIAQMRVDAKRAEAKVRQSEYDALTIEQRIAKLDAGGYNAEKQRAKLSYDLLLKSTVSRVQSKA